MYYRYMLISFLSHEEADAILVNKENGIAGAIAGSLIVDTMKENAVFWRSRDELDKLRAKGELAPE